MGWPPVLTPARTALAAGAAAVVVLAAGTSSSLSGWTSASVGNSANTAESAALAFSHSYPSGSCSAAARGTGSVSCAGTPAPTTQITGGGVTAVDTVTNGGTLAAAQVTSEFRAASCGPVQFANAKTAADPMLPRFAVGFSEVDPWSGTGAASFGSGAYAADVVPTNTGTLLGNSYALGVWFKVANGYSAGGPLMSMAASPVDGSSAASSPMLWMDTAGRIRFRVTGTLGTSASGVSASTYNDGAWHFAVLSVAATLVSTPTLYVDSAAGVTGLGLSALTGGNAYWHLGWADFTGVAGAPAATLTGSLSGAFVTSSTVSSATRTSLLGAASASAYATAVQGLTGSTHLWMLADSGTTTYAGSLPVIGATSPCSMVDVAWSVTNPAGTVAAAGTRLSTFADGAWHAVTAAGPGTAQNSTITLSRHATWNAYVSGLRLYLPLAHRVQTTGGVWSRTFTWDGAGAAVIG